MTINNKSVFKTNFARLLVILKHGPEAVEGLEASHKCHNPCCVNHAHIILESSTANVDRNNCRYGSFLTCVHREIESCIWIDVDGKSIPCRNSPNFIGQGPEHCGCFTLLKAKFESITAGTRVKEKTEKRKQTVFTEEQKAIMSMYFLENRSAALKDRMAPIGRELKLDGLVVQVRFQSMQRDKAKNYDHVVSICSHLTGTMSTLEFTGASFIQVPKEYDDFLDNLVSPQFALIVWRPHLRKTNEHVNSLYQAYENMTEEQCTVNGAIFIEQCRREPTGILALIHALANNKANLNFGDGLFGRWVDGRLSQQKRDHFDDLAVISDLHPNIANVVSEHPIIKTGLLCHFVAYSCIGGQLYEFDSLQVCPRLLGPTSQDLFVRDGLAQSELITQQLENKDWCAMALVKN